MDYSVVAAIEGRALQSKRGGLEFKVQKPVLNEVKDLS